MDTLIRLLALLFVAGGLMAFVIYLDSLPNSGGGGGTP